MTQTNCLQLTSVTSKKNASLLLDSLSLTVELPGKVALVGLNGAGKSSLIRLLVGLDEPTAGSIDIAGYHPRELPFKDMLGFQAAAMSALPFFTCREYLRLCCQTRISISSKSEAAIAQMVELWHLQDIIDRPMSQLSQGNLQKISIAQAFLGQPGFIFLDEPTQALDPIEQQRFINNLQNLQQFTLCLFSSHHINEAVQMADKVIMLHYGKFIALLNLKELDEYWLVSRMSLDELDEFFPDKDKSVDYQQNGRQLIKISSLSLAEWQNAMQALEQRDLDTQMLGTAQQALMPLFALLANEVL